MKKLQKSIKVKSVIFTFIIIVFSVITGCNIDSNNSVNPEVAKSANINPESNMYHNIALLARQQESVSISIEKASPEKAKTVTIEDYNLLMKKYISLQKRGRVDIIPLGGTIIREQTADARELNDLKIKYEILKEENKKLREKIKNL